MNTTRHFRGRAQRARAAAACIALLLSGSLAAEFAMAAKNINMTANMAFGRFVAASGGSIILGTNSTRTRTGGVILLASSASAAAFALDASGNSNKIAILTLPANGSVTLASGANRMALNNFITNFASGGVLPPSGTTANVGATLTVAPNQPPGTYSGSFHVTIDFQ